MPVFTVGIPDLRLSEYQVVVVEPISNRTWDLTKLCLGIQWSYDIENPIETYTITFARTENLADYLQVGFRVFIYATRASAREGLSFGELKLGIIWDTDIQSDNVGEYRVTAHDIAIYLVKNEGSHILEKETASTFFKRVSAKYGFKLGIVEDTKVILEREIFVNRTLFDIFATTLQHTRDLAFKKRIEGNPQYGLSKFYLQTRWDTLNLIEKRDPAYCWMFESGTPGTNPGNIISASNKFSLDHYRNVVKVYRTTAIDPTNPLNMDQAAEEGIPQRIATAPPENTWENDPDIRRFGLLSKSMTFAAPRELALVDASVEAMARRQAEDQLRQLRKVWQSGSITTFNINTIRPGDPVYVREPITGLVGKFYVRSGSHEVYPDSGTMQLTITFEDFLPAVYKSQIENESGAQSALNPLFPR